MKRIVFVLIISGIFFSGCISKPEIESVELKWGEVTSETTELLSVVTLNNPNPFSIPLSDVKVDIFMNSVHMGEGNALHDTTISPGEDTLTIASYIENGRLKDWWVTHIKNGEKTEVEVNGDIHFNILGFGLSIPTGYSMDIQTNILEQIAGSEFNVDLLGFSVIKMENTTFKWNVEDGNTQIIASMDVLNNMPSAIPVKFINGKIKMNGIDFGEGALSDEVTIPAMGKKNIEMVIDIDNSKIPEWWVNHIKNGEKTTASIDLKLGVDFAGKEQVIDVTAQKFEFYTSIATVR